MLKNFINMLRYKYLMTNKQKKEFKLSACDIPLFKLRIVASTDMTFEEADEFVKECKRIVKISGWSIYDCMDMVENNLTIGVPNKAVLSMLRNWWK